MTCSIIEKEDFSVLLSFLSLLLRLQETSPLRFSSPLIHKEKVLFEFFLFILSSHESRYSTYPIHHPLFFSKQKCCAFTCPKKKQNQNNFLLVSQFSPLFTSMLSPFHSCLSRYTIPKAMFPSPKNVFFLFKTLIFFIPTPSLLQGPPLFTFPLPSLPYKRTNMKISAFHLGVIDRFRSRLVWKYFASASLLRGMVRFVAMKIREWEVSLLFLDNIQMNKIGIKF